MRKFHWVVVTPMLLVILLTFSGVCRAADLLDSVVDVQKCDRAIDIMAMLLVGFAVILPWLQKKIKKVDTCGVMYLHGLPGLMDGAAAMFVINGLSRRLQLTGIIIAVAIALVGGYISGLVLSLFGRRVEAYTDAEEFADVHVEE